MPDVSKNVFTATASQWAHIIKQKSKKRAEVLTENWRKSVCVGGCTTIWGGENEKKDDEIHSTDWMNVLYVRAVVDRGGHVVFNKIKNGFPLTFDMTLANQKCTRMWNKRQLVHLFLMWTGFIVPVWTHRPTASTLKGVHIWGNAHQSGASSIILPPTVLVWIWRRKDANTH